MICQWYAMCDNDAVGSVAHPIRNRVPICNRCAERHDLEVDELEHQDDDGPADDSWIQSAAESAAGPTRRSTEHYDGGRLKR